jgi:uncharacterized ferritin-like protein (DUF455 family)
VSTNALHEWAKAYVLSDELSVKFAPPPPPSVAENDPPASACPELRPGHPAVFRRIERAEKSPKAGALRDPKKRAWLFHTFMHHELQAAELMAWAIVAYPDTPVAFRRGLANILLDEVRHMVLYREALESLGCALGDFGVRDWFWQRVPAAKKPAEFCAVMGLGLEAANLDHSRRYSQWLRAAGDPRGADLQDLIGDEELPHVRFALHWFRRFAGATDFATWCAHLPLPLSPVLLRGLPLDVDRRIRTGMDPLFIEQLAAVRFDPMAPRS